LLMLGGPLTPEWILAAYARGIFPWPIAIEDEMVLAWFSPDPRAILELDQLHISRRLRERLRSQCFQVTRDRDFRGVVAKCAEPRSSDGGTWITPEIASAYHELHELGYSHSVEVWREGELVGGVYGVALGGLFSGESMFHRQADASKVALVHLVQHLRERGFCLFDVQQWTPHLGRMGAIQVSRREYLRRLQMALAARPSFA
jgi:leucyl/phenylalanyl-tRNA--protein transferase